jgi:hypothetical protein
VEEARERSTHTEPVTLGTKLGEASIEPSEGPEEFSSPLSLLAREARFWEREVYRTSWKSQGIDRASTPIAAWSGKGLMYWLISVICTLRFGRDVSDHQCDIRVL